MGRRTSATAVAAVTALLAAATVAALSGVATAHSSLTQPASMSFTTDCRVSRGPGPTARNCPGPCPNIMLKRHGVGSSSSQPAATYRRGQTVRVRWARNNHEGGFVRWALVPVGSMMDAKVHEQMAFRWGCWSAGRFACKGGAHRKRFCIDDALDKPVGHAYQDWLTIPSIYPDGDYVLSFAWYGGVRNNKPKRRPVLSSLGDYYDCSYVRIAGGGVVEPAHTPTFRPGTRTRFPNRCVASVNRLGPCREEPCTVGRRANGKSLHQGGELVPAPFAGGKTPPPLRTSWFPTTGAGRLGINAAYVTDLDGRRKRRLRTNRVNVVALGRDLERFTMEATVWGDVRVDGVAFAVPGKTRHIARAAPWFLTRVGAGTKARRSWGYWTAGKVVKVKITPLAITGHDVRVVPKTYRIKVVYK